MEVSTAWRQGDDGVYLPYKLGDATLHAVAEQHWRDDWWGWCFVDGPISLRMGDEPTEQEAKLAVEERLREIGAKF